MKCAVLVVSGRPQLIADQLGEIDALVASWLPGTEGAGVADVLFGKRPFTGRLPVSWPQSEAQQPINVGDASYDPQYPYGWGLTTQAAARQKLAEARNALLRKHDPYALAAGVAARCRAPGQGLVGAAGNHRVGRSAQSAKYLERTKVDTFAEGDAVVGAARWIAQNQIGQNLDEPVSKLTSDAEHLLLTGNLQRRRQQADRGIPAEVSDGRDGEPLVRPAHLHRRPCPPMPPCGPPSWCVPDR